MKSLLSDYNNLYLIDIYYEDIMKKKEKILRYENCIFQYKTL